MSPAGHDLGEHYQMLYIQSRAPDNGRKHHPKQVGLTRNNKLTYIAASFWLFSQVYQDEHQVVGNFTSTEG
jgi:hypothetical protein